MVCKMIAMKMKAGFDAANPEQQAALKAKVDLAKEDEEASKAKIGAVFVECAGSPDGGLSPEAFCQFMAKTTPQLGDSAPSEEDMMKLFKVVDADGDGTISAEEMMAFGLAMKAAVEEAFA